MAAPSDKVQASSKPPDRVQPPLVVLRSHRQVLEDKAQVQKDKVKAYRERVPDEISRSRRQEKQYGKRPPRPSHQQVLDVKAEAQRHKVKAYRERAHDERGILPRTKKQRCPDIWE